MSVRALVLGGDGYLGWPTALHLSRAGYEVGVADNLARRGYDLEMGVDSLVPIASLQRRVDCWEEVSGKRLDVFIGDLTEGEFVYDMVARFRPDAIVHFAEQRSAPYSMADRRHAVYTQVNNVVGTLNLLYAIAETDPSIHLVKLGTMGEYGTPDIDIEEGYIEITHRGRTDVRPFEAAGELLSPVQGPRQPQHRVLLPDLGLPVYRPQSGRGLRAVDARDDLASRSGDPFRLRRRFRDRPQPVRDSGSRR